MIPEVEKKLNEKCNVKDGSTIIIGCSGGPDSMALLDILIHLRSKHNFSIIVAHINHHLRKTSDKDEILVKKFCLSNNITFKKSDFRYNKKDNFEDAARNFRNDFFIKLSKKHKAIVALAHNLSDQAETIMLHLVRGSGLKGLKGMDYTSTIKDTLFIRPLLDYTKNELEKYCLKKEIEFVKDPSNFNLKYKRNWLRHKIIPQIKEFNPKFDDALIRLSDSIKHDDIFLENMALKIGFKTTQNSVIWNRNILKKLPIPIQRRVIALGYKKLNGSYKDLLFDHQIRIEQIIAKTGEYSLPHGLKFRVKLNEAVLFKN